MTNPRMARDHEMVLMEDCHSNSSDDSEPVKKPLRTWWQYWEHEIKGSPMLGAFNIICCVVGVGLLGLPYALSQSGWIGAPLLIVTCAMATYTCVIMGDAMQAVPGCTSYGDLGQAAYGHRGSWLVCIQQHMTLIGVAAIFLVVLASGLKQVFPATFPNCSDNIMTVGFIVTFHIFLHKMNEIAILSAFNLIVAIMITVVVCYESFHNSLPAANTVMVNTVHDDAYNYQFLIAFPTIAFAFGCHTIIPAIHEELKDKSTYRPMCYVSMPITLLMYLPVAVIGYWAFGDKVADPIFKNFDSAVINFVILLLLAHVVMSYAIIMNPPELALEDQVVKMMNGGANPGVQHIAKRHRWSLRIVLRIFLTGLTVAIARAVPCFPILLSLVSSITGTTTSFIFPVLFYRAVVKDISTKNVWICNFILVFATLGGLSGTYNAILSMKNCHLGEAGC